MEHKVLGILRKYKNIFILSADKGRRTIILAKTEYTEKARQLLNDTSNHRLLITDPTTTLEKEISKTTKKLQD